MSDGRPGRPPGTPSPFKKFWVIELQGAFVRLEGIRGLVQLPRGPTAFTDDKSAIAASRHIWVGELHYVVLHQVNRRWLESVAEGKAQAKVQVYTLDPRR